MIIVLIGGRMDGEIVELTNDEVWEHHAVQFDCRNIDGIGTGFQIDYIYKRQSYSLIPPVRFYYQTRTIKQLQ